MNFGNVFKFEKFKLGNMLGKIKDNPEQLLIGAGDPFSARVWSGLTGKDYQPLVDQWGGATKDDYQKAEAAGIDTSDGRAMHGIARTIAAAFAGGYGANAAGGAMGGAGGAGAGSAGSSAGTAGGTPWLGASEAGSAGASELAPAAAESVSTSPGYGEVISNYWDKARYNVGDAMETGQGYWDKASGAWDKYGSPAYKGYQGAQQMGLLGQQQQAPMQQGQVGRQAPDFSGLLAAQGQIDAARLAEDQKRKIAQQQAIQGLLGAAYGR